MPSADGDEELSLQIESRPPRLYDLASRDWRRISLMLPRLPLSYIASRLAPFLMSPGQGAEARDTIAHGVTLRKITAPRII